MKPEFCSWCLSNRKTRCARFMETSDYYKCKNCYRKVYKEGAGKKLERGQLVEFNYIDHQRTVWCPKKGRHLTKEVKLVGRGKIKRLAGDYFVDIEMNIKGLLEVRRIRVKNVYLCGKRETNKMEPAYA